MKKFLLGTAVTFLLFGPVASQQTFAQSTIGFPGPHNSSCCANSINVDPGLTGVAANRPNMLQTTLTSASATTNTWENSNSFVTLNGPGAQNGEINVHHTFLQTNLGATEVQSENDEASALNNGTAGIHDDFLAIYHNGATGTVATLQHFLSGLTNDNTTAGVITTFVGYGCQPMAGAGTHPTNEFCFRNTDAVQSITTLGRISIGTLNAPASTTSLFIQGPDALASSFPINIKALGGANVLTVKDSGEMDSQGPLILGISGTTIGAIQFVNATSGNVKIIPPTGALGTPVLTLPAVTDTFATLASNQTFTATQNFNGVLQGSGVPGVSCTAGTLVLATFTASNGIVTHC